ncbi:TolC family protein [Mucilaginibacter pedocola]|uniref:Transporter n=1 Tax=Mucilaginibacter pedocola TaxID=1792845 RepID=A0A1S9PL34_9SPHI|nr:TolC family protein [Mucilaginibacter pedocola]OOQ61657.1 transporter [Mucilaginibacter pedocola]
MKRILVIMACAAASIKSFAQTQPAEQAYSFTVQDAVNYAYEHQDSVKNAKLDVQSAEYRIKEITSSGLPQISGSATFQDYLKTPTILFPNFITPAVYGVLIDQKVKDGTGNTITQVPDGAGGYQAVNFTQKYNANLGLTLSQILFDGAYFVGLQTRKTYRELFNRSFARTRIQTNVNVTKAYYQVLVSNEQIKLLDANIAQLKQQLDQTTAQNKQGFVEKIDVDRIAVQYNNLVTTRENTQRLLELNYQLLKFQMGMPIGQNLVLKDRLEDVDMQSTLAEASTDTTFYKKRIEYELLESNLKLSQYDVKRQKSQFYPKLMANASTAYAYQANSFGDLFSTKFPTTYVGLTLSIPIYSGGQRLNQLRQTQITEQKNQNNLNGLKNALSLQASQARVIYFNGLQSLNNQKRNQELAREVLRVSKIKYQQGVGSSIEVTQAQTGLESADNQYIQALYDALVSKVDLERAYGRIQ